MSTSRELICNQIIDSGIVAIIRANSEVKALRAAQVLIESGINVVEITMTTPGALQIISLLDKQMGKEVLIGVGSILDKSTAEEAINAGARFIVSPVAKIELIEIAHQAACPTMIGAYTPTEAQLVYEAGSDFIKLFPADTDGPAYIKAILAPMPYLKIIPTGGVNLETINSFIQAGCVAVGIGSALVSNEILKEEAWETLKMRAHAFIGALKQARQSKVKNYGI